MSGAWCLTVLRAIGLLPGRRLTRGVARRVGRSRHGRLGGRRSLLLLLVLLRGRQSRGATLRRPRRLTADRQRRLVDAAQHLAQRALVLEPQASRHGAPALVLVELVGRPRELLELVLRQVEATREHEDVLPEAGHVGHVLLEQVAGAVQRGETKVDRRVRAGAVGDGEREAKHTHKGSGPASEYRHVLLRIVPVRGEEITRSVSATTVAHTRGESSTHSCRTVCRGRTVRR